MTQPTPDPEALFTIKATPGAGRGAFATRALPAGTIIHTANDLAAHVLSRDYRGEVCWACFTYHHGKKLPIRDPLHGFAFCSTACATTAAPERHDPVSLRAWAVVEAALKAKTRREEVQVGYDEFKPTAEVVEAAWALAEGKARLILSARGEGKAGGKAGRLALHQALANPPALLLDTLTFQVHSILARYHYPARWADVLALEEDPCPYTSVQELTGYISAFLYLAAALPVELLPLVTSTPSTPRVIKELEVHNSFGIRSLEDEGSEFFGYGVWPSASFFNHSCEPNVWKVRVGRTWVFEAGRAVEAGEELHISYLGAPGEEKTLGREERRSRLERTWGFGCVCHRCEAESDGSEAPREVDASAV